MATAWFMYPEVRGYTDMSHGNHDGWDIGAPSHTPLTSLTGGTVTKHTGWYPWGGEIDTKNAAGVTETFAHADRIDVKAGDTVQVGEQVGLSGGEGLPRQFSTGPHVHYSLFGAAPWDNTHAIDPSSFLNSVRKSGAAGANLDASGSGIGGDLISGDIGTQIAVAIGETYGKAEYAVGKVVKNAAYFLIGMILLGIGIFLVTIGVSAYIGGKVYVKARPAVQAATGGVG